jgi:hypothetical protein
VTWKAVIDTQQHSHVALAQFAKLPSIVGIIAIISVVVYQSVRKADSDREDRGAFERTTAGLIYSEQ